MINEKIYVGGLMRCCLQSIGDARDDATDEPQEGDIIECKHCCGEIEYRGDGWHWKDGWHRKNEAGE